MELKIFQQWIATRGLRYAENAGNAWRDRTNKIITEWCRCRQDFTLENVIYRTARLVRIGRELEDRTQQLARAMYLKKEADRLDRHMLDLTAVLLSCSKCYMRPRKTFSPTTSDAGFKVVLFKDYVPGEHLCPECKTPMQTGEEREMEVELRKMRISQR